MASKLPKPKLPSPGVFPVIDYSTPDIRDMLIYLQVDSRLATYREPVYGSAYVGPPGVKIDDPYSTLDDGSGSEPERVSRYSNHKLVYVTPADEQGMVKWYYASDRKFQGEYNFTFAFPSTVDGGFPYYTRTYFIPRDQLDCVYNEVLIGGEDPDLSFHPFFAGFTLTETQITRSPEKALDSLYVLFTRTFTLTCDQTSYTEDKTFGGVNTITFYTKSTDSSPYIPPEVGDVYSGSSGSDSDEAYIIDIQVQDSGCGDLISNGGYLDSECFGSGSGIVGEQGKLLKVIISTVNLPTNPSVEERIDKEFCKLTTNRWYDLSTNYTLPDIGDPDPSDPTRVVVESSTRSLGQSDIYEFTVTYGVFPTPPVSTIREDQQYCRINTESYYALADTTDLPAVGEVLTGGEVVIDATAEDISCGNVRRFSVSTAVIPTPVVTTEILNKDYCRVISETNYDLRTNIGDLPEYGDSHPTEVDYQVIEAQLQDVGCGELRKRIVSYAVVPTSPVTDEVDDPQFCKMYKERFYDLSTNFTLPTKGDTYKSVYVVLDSSAVSQGCGDLMQFQISYASLPTPVVVNEVLNRDFCRVITETNYDLKSNIGALPLYGDAHPTEQGYQVTDASLEDIGCGEVSKKTISYATVPTTPVIDEVDDEQFCKTYKERFYDLSTNYTLPVKGDSYKSTYTVLDAEANALGCGDLKQFTITYATLPTPVVETEILNRDYCRVITQTNYDLKSSIGVLPSYGDSHPTETGYQVIEASHEDIGCGEVAKQSVSYATVPTQPVIDEMDDPQYCKMYKERFYDLSTNYTLPDKGDSYKTSHTVLDSKATAVGCGDLMRFEISYATLPTPVVISEVLNRDYCRVISQINYDLKSNIGALPSYGDAHPTETGYQVIEATLEDIGCGEVTKQAVSYATVPTQPVIDERDDEQFCKTYTERFYDLGANYNLPTKGSVYKVDYNVIDSKAESAGCGDLYKFEISYAAMPTPVVEREVLNQDYCRVISETNYDLRANIGSLPLYGDSHPTETGYQVIEASFEDIGCGEVTKRSVSYANVPTVSRVNQIDDPEYCRVSEVFFYDLLANTDLPEKGEPYSGGYVIDAKSEAVGCGDLMRFSIKHTQLPTPIVESSALDDEYCDVFTETYFDLKSNLTLPAHGTVHPTQSNYHVVDAKLDDTGCGDITKHIVVYADAVADPKIAVVEDPEFCRLTTHTFVRNNYDPLSLGSLYAGEILVSSTVTDVGCGTLKRIVHKTATIPTEPLYSESEDDRFCRLHTTTLYDIEANRNLLQKGDPYPHPTESEYYVIDAKLESIDCGSVKKFSFTGAQFPTPIKISERTDDERCKIVTHEFYDLNSSETIPELDDTAPFDGALSVVNVVTEAFGCGDIRRVSVSYAPTTPESRNIIKEDPTYCKTTTQINYGIGLAGSLPSNGDQYESGYVISATATDLNCGSFVRTEITTIDLPTDLRIDTNEDDNFCTLTKYTKYDLDSIEWYTRGDVYDGKTVVDSSIETIDCGPVRRYELVTGTLPSPVKITERTDNEQCRIVTESFYDLDTNYTPPQLDSVHPTDTDLRVVDVAASPYGCGGIHNYSVTYAVIPSPPKTQEREDSRFCRILTTTIYDIEGNLDLPGLGDEYGASGYRVVSANATDVNCGTLRKYEISTAAFPTSVVFSAREDNDFCTLETGVYYTDDIDSLPKRGDLQTGNLLNGTHIVDVSYKQIDCGVIHEVTITAGSLPSPKQVSEKTHDEQCRIVTESHINHEDVYTLPELDTVHPTDSTLRVINNMQDPVGCGGIFKYTTSYAVIPSPPKGSQREDPEFCTVNTDILHDLSGSFPLPSRGEVYSTGYCIDSKSESLHCGDLHRYEISYVNLPTPVIEEQTHRDDLCTIITESHYDLSTSFGVLPPSGSPKPTDSSYKLIDGKISDYGCGELAKQTLTYATIPSPKRTSVTVDEEYCQVSTDTWYDLNSYQLPKRGDVYGAEKVIDATMEPFGCGDLVRITIRYAAFPTPDIITTTSDDDFCTITTSLKYDINDTGLSQGDIYPAISGHKVIQVSSESSACAGYYKITIRSAAVPSPLRFSAASNDDFCYLVTYTNYDLSSVEPKALGSNLNDGEVVSYNIQPIGCGSIAKFTYQVAQQIPTPFKTQNSTHELFCEVDIVEWIDRVENVQTPARGIADPFTGSAKTVVDFQSQTLSCGIYAKYKMTLGVVDSSKLQGWKLNEVTGKLQSYSKYVIKTSDIDTTKKDVDSQGSFTAIEPYGCGLSLAVEGNVKPYDTLEWNTTVNYNFPRVLDRVTLYRWGLRAGGYEIYPQIIFAKYGYEGPCAARIVETYHATIPAPETVKQFTPTNLVYTCPTYRINTGACLHPEANFNCNFGNGHPKYKWTYNTNLRIPATTDLDWPTDEFIGGWTVRPYGGGFISRTVYITPPHVDPPPPPGPDTFDPFNDPLPTSGS